MSNNIIRRTNKILIRRANKDTAQGVMEGLVLTFTYNKFCRVRDYIDELRQQAKWNAEKCQHES